MRINSSFKLFRVDISQLQFAWYCTNEQKVLVYLVHVSRVGFCLNFLLDLARPRLDVYIADKNHRIGEVRDSKHGWRLINKPFPLNFNHRVSCRWLQSANQWLIFRWLCDNFFLLLSVLIFLNRRFLLNGGFFFLFLLVFTISIFFLFLNSNLNDFFFLRWLQVLKFVFIRVHVL